MKLYSFALLSVVIGSSDLLFNLKSKCDIPEIIDLIERYHVLHRDSYLESVARRIVENEKIEFCSLIAKLMISIGFERMEIFDELMDFSRGISIMNEYAPCLRGYCSPLAVTRKWTIDRRWIVKANNDVCKSDEKISAFKIERKCSEILIIPFASIRPRRRLYKILSCVFIFFSILEINIVILFIIESINAAFLGFPDASTVRPIKQMCPGMNSAQIEAWATDFSRDVFNMVDLAKTIGENEIAEFCASIEKLVVAQTDLALIAFGISVMKIYKSPRCLRGYCSPKTIGRLYKKLGDVEMGRLIGDTCSFASTSSTEFEDKARATCGELETRV